MKIMGDFLTDIAEKSFATEYAIRPRPLSLYETFQASGAANPARIPEDKPFHGSVSREPYPMTGEEGQDDGSGNDTTLTENAELGFGEAPDGSRTVNSAPMHISRMKYIRNFVRAELPGAVSPDAIMNDAPESTGTFDIAAREGRAVDTASVGNVEPEFSGTPDSSWSFNSVSIQKTGIGNNSHLVGTKMLRPVSSAAIKDDEQKPIKVFDTTAGEGKADPPMTESLPESKSYTATKARDNKSSCQPFEIAPLGDGSENKRGATPFSATAISTKRNEKRDRESGFSNQGTKATSEIVLNPVIGEEVAESPIFQISPRQQVSPPDSRPVNTGGRKNDLPEREKPAPTIQVTIGRIDVRAIHVPAQKESRPKTRSAMSLDEYLSKRNGERR